MPRLMKARMTNIHLDEGKKRIADSTWEPNAKDALFILENGGGKTSFIQLITQTILPNTNLSKRLLKEVLGKGTTGHIMTEWKLDGENLPHDFLCLGFTFVNGATKSEDLKYFTYYFNYNRKDSLTIDNLQVQQNGSVTRYGEYRSFLRQNEVRIFDVNRDYKRELKRFHILEDEWKMIQKINGDEGGVDKYFQKASTTYDLMVKLLIPEVENTIFDSPEKKKEVQMYFKEYSKNLLRIPDMERDLADFYVIKDAADDVLKAVEKHQKEKNAFLDIQRHLVVLKKSLDLEVGKKENHLLALEREQEGLEAQEQEAQWKIDSYKVHQLNKTIEKHIQEYEKAKQKHESKQSELEQAKDQLKRWEAFKEYETYLNYDRQVQKIRAELNALSASNPELEKERNESKQLLSEAITYLIEEKEEDLEKQKNVISSISEDIASKETEFRRLNEEKQQSYSDFEKAKAAAARFRKDQQFLSERIGNHASDQPDCTKEKLEHAQNRSFQQVEEKKEKQNLNQEWVSIKSDWNSDQRLMIQRKENELEEYRKEKEIFEREKEKLMVQIKKEGHEVEDLQKEVEEWISFFGREKTSSEQEVDTHKQAIKELDKKIELWETHDYFITNETLLDIQSHLEDQGVIAMLGSEWLSGLNQESLKQDYLQSYPLLPYALLVEESQLKDAKKAMNRLGDKLLDTPILFYTKSQLKVREKATIQTGDLFSLREELWVYHALDVQWFASKKKIEEIIVGLKEKRRIRNDQLFFSKGRFSEIEKVLKHLNQFRETYHLSFESDNERGEEKLLSEIENIKEELETAKQEIQTKEDENEEIRNFIQDEIGLQAERKSTIQILKRFIEDYPNPNEILNRPKELEIKYEQNLTKAELCEEELQGLRGQKEEEVQTENQIKMAFSHLKNEKQQYYISDDVEPSDSFNEEEKYRLIARYKASQKEYDQKEQVKVIMEENLSDKEGERTKAKDNLNRIGFTIYEVKEIYRKEVDLNFLIETQREKTYTISIMVIDLGNDKSAKEATANTMKEQLEGTKKDIEEVYLLDVYEYNQIEYENEYEHLLNKKNEMSTKKTKIELQQQEIDREKRDVELALNTIESVGNLPIYKEEYGLIKLEKILEKSKLVSYNAKENIQNFKTKKGYAANAKVNVNTAFEAYVERVNRSKNEKVERFTHGFSKVRDSEKLFDFEYITETFVRIFETIVAFEKDLKRKIEECKKDKVKLVELCYQRIESIYKNIIEIPKYSKVNVFNQELQLIKLRWERFSEEETRNHLQYHVELILQRLSHMKENNEPENEMNEYLKLQLDNIELLGKIAPINKCRVRIYKPRKESLATTSAENWKPWDEVVKWSGGEEFSSYMCMFMILITYLRKKVNAKDDSWKVIIADNPFGKASSEHVVKPIIELARKSNIQLFCLTAHKHEDIRSHFECVMSNRYYNAGGTEVLHVKQDTNNVNLGIFSYEHD